MKAVLFNLLLLSFSISAMTLQNGDYRVKINENNIQMSIYRDNRLVYQTHYAKSQSKNSFAIKPMKGAWQSAKYLDNVIKDGNRYLIKLRTNKNAELYLHLLLLQDEIKLTLQSNTNCKEIRINSVISTSGHWYGEGETVSRLGIVPIIRGKMQQYWPLSRGQMIRKKMATTDNSSVLVPFWLTSKGVALFSDSYHYLHEIFNKRGNDLFSLGMLYNKNTRPNNREFSLHIIVQENIRNAYLYWIHKDYQHKKRWNQKNPLPPYPMFKGPIWTTWATYKSKISTQKIFDFADKIIESEYPYSILEIDDRWQSSYGDLHFDNKRFPNAETTIAALKELGFETTVWMPPFVNKKSQMYRDLKNSEGLIKNSKGKTYLVSWWDTLYLRRNSGIFNFFNKEFKNEFTSRVQTFTAKFDLLGIKYDAGETVYLKDNLKAYGHHPNSYSDLYIRNWREMRAMEFRAATFSQHEAPIIREFDKNSTWDNYTGLKSVLTQALAMGIVGYPFVLPDMVGGNRYPFSNLSDELFVRWIQLNAFMPMIQLSLGPWEFNSKTEELSKKYLQIHQKLVPYIWEQVELSNQTALPLVRPLFLEYPEDQNGYSLDDQFLLGDRYLVAPIFTKGVRSRHIYLPAGQWKDFWSGAIYEGGKWLKNYPAPIEIIPVFILQ